MNDLRASLSHLSVSDIAKRVGAVQDEISEDSGILKLPVWREDTSIAYPGYYAYNTSNQQKLNLITEALLLYYLSTSDGTSQAGQLISFSDLPDGKFYAQAFQGYSGNELARHFKNDIDRFHLAAQKEGGIPLRLGDAAYVFPLFPNVAVGAVCWLGDEDLPPNYQILFDAALPHHLPTDACAIAGSQLTKKLIQAG